MSQIPDIKSTPALLEHEFKGKDKNHFVTAYDNPELFNAMLSDAIKQPEVGAADGTE